MFSGRGDELLSLEKAVFQTKHGNPQHFLVTGERGIGKSSLLLFLEYLSTGLVKLSLTDPFRLLVVSIQLDISTTYPEIIGKIGSELQRVVASENELKELAKSAWGFLSRWEVFGLKYQAIEQKPEIKVHDLLEELTHTIVQLMKETKDKYNGLLILIDEADKPEASANLGEFVKLFTERITKRGCNNVCLGLAGLPHVLRVLRASHPSSARVFQVFNLEPLAREDGIDVLRKGLAAGKNKTGLEVKITADAEDAIYNFSEGYPHFIQQFAYSAFEKDLDNEITSEDVLNGAFAKGGAFHQLGIMYFEDLYFEKIWSDEYRAVLRSIAEAEEPWVTKAMIRKKVALKETTLNNALAALTKRHIILPRKGRKGVYCLPSKSFAVWIKAFTQRPTVAESKSGS